MNLLSRVRQQYQVLAAPKAISHRPDLAGREHVYRQGAASVVQEMDKFADYATVYSTYAWVQKAVGKIAENMAGLPVRVVDGKDKPLDTHPISLLLNHVNDEQTPLDLWSSYVVNMLLGGEAPYELVPDRAGRPVEIWLRRPDLVAVVPDATRLDYPTAIGYIYTGEVSSTLTIEAKYMVFDKFYNPLNPWRGLAPIHAVREGITIDLFAQQWSKRFFTNSARPDFAIIAPQGITQSEKNDYEARFMAKHRGSENAHLPVILEEGVTDIKTFSFAPKDIEWLSQRQTSRDEVGAIFGVPDEIMGYGKDTYENFQTALKTFWTLTLAPFIRRRDITLTHHFRRYGWLAPTERVDTDLSDVGELQADLTPKVDLALKFWGMGVPFNTLDEQLKLGIGPVAGGEIGYLATSLTTVEMIAEPPAPPPVPQLPAPTDAPQDAPDMGEPDDDDEPMMEDAPVQRTVYLLPEGAKENAKRELKKLIQGIQDDHLRALRAGGHLDAGWCLEENTRGPLRRWLGAGTDPVIDALEESIYAMRGNHDAVNAAYAALKTDESIAKLLEVEAATAFFTRALTLPAGPITHSVYKQLILQLDPEDDEAERNIRGELERKLERELTVEFKAQLATLLPDDASDETIRQAASQVVATSEPVREVLRRNLEQSASLGVSIALDTLENIGLGFDWTLANTDAAKWASQYSYELVRGINSTSAGRLQVAVDDWFKERTTLPDLVRELEPTFGRRRARTIAQTETTRAAAQGSILGFEQSGVVDQAEWVTVKDERVCPTCGPLHGKRAPLRGTFEGGKSYPPAHPKCRCFVRPVVKEANE